MAEGDQRRVDAVLEHRAVLDQMHPKARLFSLAPDPRIGQPDLRDQVALRQHGQHARVDPVGLARQRRQALDLGRVGDQHIPAELLKAIMHEPRAGHRLDHPTHRQPVAPDTARQAAQTVGIRRRRELLDDLATRRQQADIDLASTQIQSSVQHEDGPPQARSLGQHAGACHRGGPPSWQSSHRVQIAARSPRLHTSGTYLTLRARGWAEPHLVGGGSSPLRRTRNSPPSPRALSRFRAFIACWRGAGLRDTTLVTSSGQRPGVVGCPEWARFPSLVGNSPDRSAPIAARASGDRAAFLSSRPQPPGEIDRAGVVVLGDVVNDPLEEVARRRGCR